MEKNSDQREDSSIGTLRDHSKRPPTVFSSVLHYLNLPRSYDSYTLYFPDKQKRPNLQANLHCVERLEPLPGPTTSGQSQFWIMKFGTNTMLLSAGGKKNNALILSMCGTGVSKIPKSNRICTPDFGQVPDFFASGTKLDRH